MQAPKGRSVFLIAGVLLAVHAGLMLWVLRHTFITVDEPGHVAAGLSYWETGRFLVYRVNPPLAKMLAVLPVLAARPKTDFHEMRDAPGWRAEWSVGPEFVKANESRIFDLVCLARLTGVAWSVLAGLLIFCWSRALYGDAAGCVALTLWCFEPSILGHGPLATADVPAAVAGLAATAAFTHYLKAPSWRRALIAGVVLGFAELVKFSLVLFYGLWPLLWLLSRALRRGAAGEDRTRDPRAEVGQLILIAALSVYVINIGYFFDGSLRPLGEYEFVSRAFTGLPEPPAHDGSFAGAGNRFRRTWLDRIPVPLPADVLLGIDIQRRDFESRWHSYLRGVWQREGWWYYYLYVLAVKLPLGTIALLVWGVADTLVRRRGRNGLLDEVVLLTTAVLFLAFISSQTGFSHHGRYALPVLPYLMILAGRLAEGARRWRLAAVLALLFAAVASSLAVFPHSLSYFNEAAGGPANGHAHLLDSNLDWGQDLLYLKDWLAAHPEARPIHLAYFNVIDPRIIGIDFRIPPSSAECLPRDRQADVSAAGPQPGYHAVSVNFLRGLEFGSMPDGRGGHHHAVRREYEYFRDFEPIARAGYSIFIYHITPEQARAAHSGDGVVAR